MCLPQHDSGNALYDQEESDRCKNDVQEPGLWFRMFVVLESLERVAGSDLKREGRSRRIDRARGHRTCPTRRSFAPARHRRVAALRLCIVGALIILCCRLPPPCRRSFPLLRKSRLVIFTHGLVDMRRSNDVAVRRWPDGWMER